MRCSVREGRKGFEGLLTWRSFCLSCEFEVERISPRMKRIAERKAEWVEGPRPGWG